MSLVGKMNYGKPIKILWFMKQQPESGAKIFPAVKFSQLLSTNPNIPWWQRLRGIFLVGLGYLLSPLCWWNDLVFNLPIAYGFGYLCRLISSDLLIPGAIAGYWLSNVAGILLMQAGFLDVVRGETEKRNLKQELLTGVLSSTAYTGLIVLLLQFKILEAPLLALHP
jgi:hypothetical protein